MAQNSQILSLSGVTKSFGGVVAVRDVSMDVAHGERRLIIGTNGAGKSTLFNLICGDIPLTSGTVRLFERDVTHLDLRRRALMGMRRTYQATALFNKLTVRQNFYLALLGERSTRHHFNLFTNYKNSGSYNEKIEQTAALVDIQEKLDEVIDNISHGERRQLELGLALISQPKLLLLDEPSSGLSASERQKIQAILQNLDPQITLLLVEHNMELAFAVATDVTVMQNGEIVCEGSPQAIRGDEYVQKIYLGGGRA
ncbi:ABC transporter ATP-binding protein [Feifania hominis]|uniref:ABC transporter ATP-binding protein n=1 Tax=Feifania hominis TaxID=2763660 RepID=A0A926DB85_9FIRM|nr:ABC transporter ATP-binding protein [Feifania hominis]MBC8535328.1 ABC transporter ATP-binding protein [Feifania hominis]